MELPAGSRRYNSAPRLFHPPAKRRISDYVPSRRQLTDEEVSFLTLFPKGLSAPLWCHASPLDERSARCIRQDGLKSMAVSADDKD
jgi:hypothetical protein